MRGFSEMGLRRLALTANRSWELIYNNTGSQCYFVSSISGDCMLAERILLFGKADLISTRQKLGFTSLHQICIYTSSDKRRFLAISLCSVDQTFEEIFLC